MTSSVGSIPSVGEAEEMLAWAAKQNPGNWVDHSFAVAKAAQRIALSCDMDKDAAYVLGLLHDIGRFEGGRGSHHIMAGYNLMTSKGYHDVAKVCLTHSFPLADFKAFGGEDLDFSPDELDFIAKYITKRTYDTYDKLIQLSDALGSHVGITTIETRLVDVARRHGVNKYTVPKWDSFFALKEMFDDLSGTNIYRLFAQEIMDSIL